MNRFYLFAVTIISVLFLSVPAAQACPMCGEAMGVAQTDQAGSIPYAFYCSILFMLSMPFLLSAGFGFYFYTIYQRAQPVAGIAPNENPALEPVAAEPAQSL